MKKKRKILGRKLLIFLLTLAMVIGLMPGMGLTALADTPKGTEIINEDFTNGIPSTWTSSTGDYHFEAKDGYVWTDPNNGQREDCAYLYSPVLDLSEALSATLVFKYKKPFDMSSDGSGTDDCFVYYRINGGELKKIWEDITIQGIADWTSIKISLPIEALTDKVQIVFGASKYRYQGAFFDEIAVYCTKSIEATDGWHVLYIDDLETSLAQYSGYAAIAYPSGEINAGFKFAVLYEGASAPYAFIDYGKHNQWGTAPFKTEDLPGTTAHIAYFDSATILDEYNAYLTDHS